MEQVIEFLKGNENVVWVMLSFIIFGIMYGLKMPYKKLTSKISNETARQIANKAIVLFTFAVSIGLTIGYCELVNIEFSLVDSIKYATTAIAMYSATEIKKGNKDCVFSTEEAKEVVDTVVEMASSTKEKKKKKKEKATDTESQSAIDIFKSAMGEKK